MDKDRRENLELRKKIDEMIECKGDACETRQILEKVRTLKEYYEEEAAAYREAIQNLLKKMMREDKSEKF